MKLFSDQSEWRALPPPFYRTGVRGVQYCPRADVLKTVQIAEELNTVFSNLIVNKNAFQ